MRILFYSVVNQTLLCLQHSQTGLTPLMAAVVRGYVDLSEQLLNLGASVSVKCSNEMSALDWAVKENRTDVLELLYSYM